MPMTLAPLTVPARLQVSLNQEWRFCSGHSDDHLKAGYDDSAFERVTLPHTTALMPVSGGDNSAYQKVTTYRRAVDLPEMLEGRRILLNFEGAMAFATVHVNGRLAGEHYGGYTPFTLDVTDLVSFGGKNVVAVRLDSTERPDTPPFGGPIDYLTYGGLYRDANLRAVSPVYLERVFVSPSGVAAGKPRLEVTCSVRNAGESPYAGRLNLEIPVGGGKTMRAQADVAAGAHELITETVEIVGAEALELWDLDRPVLYHLQARLTADETAPDEVTVRFGMREAEFTREGFRLNGRVIKLRGLNRHQSFPWVGYAMPPRVQRRDAEILKHELKLNVVRSSHYPQSPHFLDRCDEIGLLVLDEIPGWQHIGDAAWKDKACRSVTEMVERDYNHPSVILWCVRINESHDDDEFYTRTTAIARALDPTRQTGGVRFFPDSHLIEDVFTLNDFNPDVLTVPVHPRHLVTEFCGHMYPTKHVDNVERITEHFRRHAHVQSLVGANPAIAGALGWCAFDYNTHGDFGSGDGVCHHGVCDMFRIPKLAAGLYRSQCSPEEEIVLEPVFSWAPGDIPAGGGVGSAFIASNCDRIEVYAGGKLADELFPCCDQFPGLPHPPFRLGDKTMVRWGDRWGDLRLAGYIGGELVAEKRMSSSGRNAGWHLTADDAFLSADGTDATRVWFAVTDEYGNRKPFATGAISFEITGPGVLIGDNPFALIGGCGAVWVRAGAKTGKITLTGRHQWLGERAAEIIVEA